MTKRTLKVFLITLMLTGCNIGNNVNNQSSKQNTTNSQNESISSSNSSNNEVKNELQLLSFKAIDETVAIPMTLEGEVNSGQEVLLDKWDSNFKVEAIVKNESRLSFVDMVLYISFLDTYVAFNNGNGDYTCSATTILENEIWVTKISFDINVDFSNSYFGYVEVQEINFLDLNSSISKANLTKIDSKRVNYHRHYGEEFNRVEPTCSEEGYSEFTCEYCHETYRDNYVEIDENNHLFIDGICQYCGYKDYNAYVPKAPEGYINADINYHYVADELDSSIVTKDTYNCAFTTDPTTFDYLANNKTYNQQYTTNFVDGLLEHTPDGDLTLGLACAIFYSEDYSKLRVELRTGVSWVDNNMIEYAKVTAHDFKTGLQHLLDAKGGAENLAYYIKGAKAYADGVNPNFDNVGINIINDYEFEYIFENPTPFFHTLLTSSSFKPLNRDFFEELDGVLGEGWDPQACGFGKITRPQTLLYCGPYVLKEHSRSASLSMVKNEEYWDIDNVNINEINYVYNSGVDAASLVEMFKNGELDSLGVNNINYDLVESEFGEEYIYEQGTGTTTYYFNWNLNRQTYAVGDCVSGKTTDAQKENTRKAILNENFRKAIFSAIPKIELNALQNDAETALSCIRNTFTAPELVSIGTSIENETGVTHAAGSQYYEMVNKEMKVLNEENGDDFAKYKSSYVKEDAVESSCEKIEENLSTFKDRENSYFNEETALILAKKAKTELEAQGVTFPVHIDYLCYDASYIFIAQAQLLKKEVERIVNANDTNLVEINIQDTSNMFNYETSHFLAPTGADMNFDLSSGTSWRPDYGDPATFLNTLAWEGELFNNLGFDSKPEDKVIYEQVLGDYQALYEDAQESISNLDARYVKFAAAEAELLSSAVIMPNTTDGGGYAISRIVPETKQKAKYGFDMYRYKFMVISSTPL